MTHRWTVKTMSVGALLFCALGSALGQTHPEPYTLLEQYIGLKEDQIANIEHGKAVAQILPSAEPSEVVVFDALRMHASPEDYLRLAPNLVSSALYRTILVFGSTPPKLSDLEGFVLEDDDIKDLKSYRPGEVSAAVAHELN
jgi:hypothetical protein